MYSTVLKLLRQYHALPGYEMAKRLDLSGGMISEMEHKDKPVSFATLEKAGLVFQMPVSSLVVLAEVLQTEGRLPQPGMCEKAIRILAWAEEVGACAS
jgi:transcriptional regulator with XRE-family HTH domain